MHDLTDMFSERSKISMDATEHDLQEAFFKCMEECEDKELGMVSWIE